MLPVGDTKTNITREREVKPAETTSASDNVAKNDKPVYIPSATQTAKEEPKTKPDAKAAEIKTADAKSAPAAAPPADVIPVADGKRTRDGAVVRAAPQLGGDGSPHKRGHADADSEEGHEGEKAEGSRHAPQDQEGRALAREDQHRHRSRRDTRAQGREHQPAGDLHRAHETDHCRREGGLVAPLDREVVVRAEHRDQGLHPVARLADVVVAPVGHDRGDAAVLRGEARIAQLRDAVGLAGAVVVAQAERVPDLVAANVAQQVAGQFVGQRQLAGLGIDRRALSEVPHLGELHHVVPEDDVGGLGLLWPLYLLAMVQAVLAAAGAPARRTFVPRLVPPEQLTAAIALNTLSGRIVMLAGFVGCLGITPESSGADEVVCKSSTEVPELLRAVKRLAHQPPPRRGPSSPSGSG